jgi:NADPH-dependent ferric siderophore reductase
MRTYTIRRLRDDPAELDVDFVLHGETGPATRWAMHARPGDLLQIAAPNAEFRADPGGYEWRPPPQLARLILFGDETALPAISGILDALAASSSPPRTEVFLEVPMPGDLIAVTTWPDCRLSWTVRSGTPGETLLRSALDLTLSEMHAPHEAAPIVNVDREILWETNAAPSDELYIWAAGEAKAILALRKFLQSERGVGRNCMNMMGYWRLGRSLDD